MNLIARRIIAVLMAAEILGFAFQPSLRAAPGVVASDPASPIGPAGILPDMSLAGSAIRDADASILKPPVAGVQTLPAAAVAQSMAPSAAAAATARRSARPAAGTQARPAANPGAGALGVLRRTAGRLGKRSSNDAGELKTIFDAEILSRPAESLARETAQEFGLLETYAGLQNMAAKRHGLLPARRAELVGRQLTVTPRTRIGLPKRGEATWLPYGGGESNVQRAIGVSLARGAMAKIKGAGGDSRAALATGDRMGTPVQVAREPFRRGLPWTWKYLFGSSLEEARIEFANLLQAHALFRRALGKPAPFPIPVDVHALDTVEIGGNAVSVLRAWSDKRLWKEPAAYYKHFANVLKLARGYGAPGELHSRIENWEEVPQAAKRRWLKRRGMPTEDLFDEVDVSGLYVRARIAQRLLLAQPLGQTVLLERGPVRNNSNTFLSADYFRTVSSLDFNLIRRLGIDEHDFRREVRRSMPQVDPIVSAMLSAYGRAYRRPTVEDFRRLNPKYPDMWRNGLYESYYMQGVADVNRGALARVYLQACRELGEAYGLLASIGAHSRGVFKSKDLIGGQVTDFVDMGMPLRGTDKFDPVSAKGDFWIRKVDKPNHLYEFLYYDEVPEEAMAGDSGREIHSRGMFLFAESARRAFRLGLERLVIGNKADGLLSPAYRASLLKWFRLQAGRSADEPGLSADESYFRRLFGPVLTEFAAYSSFE